MHIERQFNMTSATGIKVDEPIITTGSDKSAHGVKVRFGVPNLGRYGIAMHMTPGESYKLGQRLMDAATDVSPRACTECGCTALTWHASIVNRSDVQQGRLNTHDVECIFSLGCDQCSETLETISADKAASLIKTAAA